MEADMNQSVSGITFIVGFLFGRCTGGSSRYSLIPCVHAGHGADHARYCRADVWVAERDVHGLCGDPHRA